MNMVSRSPSHPVTRQFRETGRPGSRAILLVVLVLLAPQLSASVSTSALTGRVTSGGKAVANATVTATSPALQHERVTVTGSGGTYWLGALPPGQYEVTFASKGLQTLTRRAVVELARIARADAQLEPSEDEDSVTSTATTVSVVHDTALTTHRNAEALDRLPLPVSIYSATYLAPASFLFFPRLQLDAAPVRITQDVLANESAEELTFLRGVTPLEYARGGDSAIAARTRSGGEELHASVRDTLTSARWLGGGSPYRGSIEHFLESASGGHILPNRLWFFGAGWNGTRADGAPYDRKGLELKLTAQPDARQSLMAAFFDNENSYTPSVNDSRLLAVVHTAQWSPRILSEIVANRVEEDHSIPGFGHSGVTDDALAAKTSFVAGDHVLSGGVDYEEGRFFDARSLFVSDRVWLQRWVLNAGIRYGNERPEFGFNPGGPVADDHQFSAQVAAAYDLRGRGRNAVTASATRYAGELDELTVGYVMALGSTGSARLVALRRDFRDQFTIHSLQLDSSYRLFDRFEAGLNYTYTDSQASGLIEPILSRNIANAWLSAEVPFAAQALTAMIAYRYASAPAEFAGANDGQDAIDVALRYTIPIQRVALTVAAEALNVFDRDGVFQPPRIARGWIRVRL